jgi:hypothetical protein
MLASKPSQQVEADSRPFGNPSDSVKADRALDLPPVTEHLSPVSSAISRVVGIAPAPLLPGEKETDYAEAALRIVKAATPRDAIEDLLTRDVIDLSWEVLRLRRLKAGLLRGAIGSGTSEVMYRLGYEEESAEELAANWAAGKKAAQKEVAAALQKAQLTMEDVMAETLEGKIDSFERFDRMLASSEVRRNNALREIDRHRAAFGAPVRQAIDELQDAEFRDVETGGAGVGVATSP